MTAAASGRARPSCARATRNSPSRAPRTAWRAASTAPASSRSTPVTSGPGPCSSPNPTSSRRSSACRAFQARSDRAAMCRACRDRRGLRHKVRLQARRRPHPNHETAAMRRLRRIKILATLGPASSDSAMIRRLFEAGADIFRINMSHTSHDKLRELVATIRNVESSYGRPIGILVDLQGPKLRLGTFADGAVQLQNGHSFVLDSDATPGDATRVQLPHPEILAALRPGHALLLDDGKVRLIAEETSPTRAVTR